MCINTSNFFTRSRPIWERRESLTLPAPLALPRLRGGDPGSSEVRTTPLPSPLPRPGEARSCAPLRSAPLLRGRRDTLPPPRRGLGMGPATGTGLGGNLQPSLAFIYVFFTAPGVYLAVRFPRGQFAAPKRSSRFELNTANKISVTLITPCMNISFT